MIWRQDLIPQYKKYEKEIDSAIKRVLESGRYTLARECADFESQFAGYLGSKYAVGVGNATDGLILAMKALGIGTGDEVITTPFTAIPTASAIVATGAKPVFVDIDEETFLIDIKKVQKNITPKTKAIIPVHIFGNVVDIAELRAVVPSHIPIIEDAAQAHGSKIKGKFAGTMGNMGVFSFYPTKNIGGYGDGGAVVTNDKALADKIKLLRMYGMADKDHIIINGVNSRLDELQAAILMVKLKHLDEMNQLRNTIAENYKKILDSKQFSYQKIPENVYSNFHIFTVLFKGDRNKLIKALEDEGIQTNIYYVVPLHLQEANKNLRYKKGDLPITEKICNEALALPMYPELPLETVKKIAETINKHVRQAVNTRVRPK